MPSRRSLPPVACWRGVSPSEAANPRPLLNRLASPTVATTAVAITGPTPGASVNRLQASSSRVCRTSRPSRSAILASIARKCSAWSTRSSRARGGSRSSSRSETMASRSLRPAPRCAATIPNSAMCPRIALIVPVRSAISRSRIRCSIRSDCCCSLFTGTKRMPGRCTASQQASASAGSCLFVFT